MAKITKENWDAEVDETVRVGELGGNDKTSGYKDREWRKKLPASFLHVDDYRAETSTFTTGEEGSSGFWGAPVLYISSALERLKNKLSSYLPLAGGIIKGNLGLAVQAAIYGLHQLGGGMRIQALATPAAPSVQTSGTTGTASYTYFVVAEDRNGYKTVPSSGTTITTANAILDANNYNIVSWEAVVGAVKYYVLKTNTGTLLGSTTETSLNDIGQATAAFTAPKRNGTGDAIIDGSVTATDGVIVGEGKKAVWMVDPKDTTSVEDGYTVLVTDEGVRLKRVIENGELDFGWVPGANDADNMVSLLNAACSRARDLGLSAVYVPFSNLNIDRSGGEVDASGLTIRGNSTTLSWAPLNAVRLDNCAVIRLIKAG
jgi:hypothetical protein